MDKKLIIAKVLLKISKRPNLEKKDIHWELPSWADEKNEFRRYKDHNLKEWEGIFEESKRFGLSELPQSIWSKLQNTDSYDIKNLDKAESMSRKYHKNIYSMYDAIRGCKPLPAPVILDLGEGSYELVGGNTRLMVARALKQKPKVLFVRSNK